MQATQALHLEIPPQGQWRYELPAPTSGGPLRWTSTWSAGMWPVQWGPVRCEVAWQVKDDTLTLRVVASVRDNVGSVAAPTGRCPVVLFQFTDDYVLPDPQLVLVGDPEAGPPALVITAATGSGLIHRLPIFLQPVGDGTFKLGVELERHIVQELGAGLANPHRLCLLSNEAFMLCDKDKALYVIDWPINSLTVLAVRPVQFERSSSLSLVPGLSSLFRYSVAPISYDTFEWNGVAHAMVLWANGEVQVFRFNGVKPATVGTFKLPLPEGQLPDVSVTGLVYVVQTQSSDADADYSGLFDCYIFADFPGPRRIHVYQIGLAGRGMQQALQHSFPSPPGHALHRIIQNLSAGPPAVALWHSPSGELCLQGLSGSDPRCWTGEENLHSDVCYCSTVGSMALIGEKDVSVLRMSTLLDSVENAVAESQLGVCDGLAYFCGSKEGSAEEMDYWAEIIDCLLTFSENDTADLLSDLQHLERQLPQTNLTATLWSILQHLPPSSPDMEEEEINHYLGRLRGLTVPPFEGGPVELVARIAANMLDARSALVATLARFVDQFSTQYHDASDDESREFVARVGEWCLAICPSLTGLTKASQALSTVAKGHDGAGFVQALHTICNQIPIVDGDPLTMVELQMVATYLAQSCWATHLEERPGRRGPILKYDATKLLWLASTMLEGTDYDGFLTFLDAFQPEVPLLKHFRGFLHLNPQALDVDKAVACWREVQIQLQGLRPTEESMFHLLLSSLTDTSPSTNAGYPEQYQAALVLYINQGLRASVASPSIRSQLGGNTHCLALLLPDSFDRLPVAPEQGDMLFYQRLHHHARYHEWAAAYKFVAAQNRAMRRREGVLFLCGQLVEQCAFSHLVELAYEPELLHFVISYLWTKAECTDVHLLVEGANEELKAGLANYYQLLYAFLFHRYDLPSACHVMYRLAERYKVESLCRPQDWSARHECLAACCTTLALLPDGLQAFVYDPQNPPPVYMDGRQQRNDGGMALVAQGSSSNRVVVTLPIVRRELLRTKVELELCRATIDQWTPGEMSPLRTWSRLEKVGDLVSLLVEHRLYSTAVSLCLEFHANGKSNVEVDSPLPYLDNIFGALASNCATLQMGSTGRNPAVTQAWNLLREFLLHVAPEGKGGVHYYETVLTALLTSAPGMSIPPWIIQPVRQHNPTKLIQLYLASDMVEAAAQVAWEYLAWRFRPTGGPSQGTVLPQAGPGVVSDVTFAPHVTVSNAIMDRLHACLRTTLQNPRSGSAGLVYAKGVLQQLDRGLVWRGMPAVSS